MNIPDDVREWIYERAHKCVDTTENVLGVRTAESRVARKAMDWLDSLPAAPVVPEPDWSQAPEWAEWWAISKNGLATWFSREPERASDMWATSNTETEYGYLRSADVYDYLMTLPFDWRTTLRRRPEAERFFVVHGYVTGEVEDTAGTHQQTYTISYERPEVSE